MAPKSVSLTLAVPANDCVRLDDHQTGSPSGPEARKPSPEDPVALSEAGAAHGSLQHTELMPQGEVLGGKRCSGAEENDRQPDEREHGAEGRAMALLSRRAQDYVQSAVQSFWEGQRTSCVPSLVGRSQARPLEVSCLRSA